MSHRIRFAVITILIGFSANCVTPITQARPLAGGQQAASCTWQLDSSDFGTSGLLNAVAVNSATDAWAVGSSEGEGLVDHFDGSTWTPYELKFGGLQSVVALSASNVWAAGYERSRSVSAIIEHYNGTIWKKAKTPKLPVSVQAIAGTASSLWAVAGSNPGRNLGRSLYFDGTSWSLVAMAHTSQNQGASSLSGLAVESPTDVWAVGSYVAKSGQTKPLVEHYDGTSWTVQTLPAAVDAAHVALHAITAVSPTELWAVGTDSKGNTVFLHYLNGVWSNLAGPDVSANKGVLASISAVSPTDIWAAGTNRTGYTSLVEHFDGTTWSVVASPNASTGSARLTALGFSGTNDLWAVGGTAKSEPGLLTEHWNGTAWTVVGSLPPDDSSAFYGAAATGPTDAWEVGRNQNQTVLARHFDGTSWTDTPVPSTGKGESNLTAVAGDAGTDVWAVGWQDHGSGPYPVVDQYDGTQWTAVPVSIMGIKHFQLLATDVLSSTDVWAAGAVGYTDTGGPLIAHFDGENWSAEKLPAYPGHALFWSVDAISDNDVWAGGVSTGKTRVPMVVHYDGTKWTRVKLPKAKGANVYGVTGTSDDDLWMAGTTRTHASLIEHFDGSHWSVQASVNPKNGEATIWGLSERSPSDVWAYGWSKNNSLIEHFDGTTWSIESSPQLPSGGQLYDMAFTSATSGWTVGSDAYGFESITASWNGVSCVAATAPEARGAARSGRSSVMGHADENPSRVAGH